MGGYHTPSPEVSQLRVSAARSSLHLLPLAGRSAGMRGPRPRTGRGWGFLGSRWGPEPSGRAAIAATGGVGAGPQVARPRFRLPRDFPARRFPGTLAELWCLRRLPCPSLSPEHASAGCRAGRGLVFTAWSPGGERWPGPRSERSSVWRGGSGRS